MFLPSQGSQRQRGLGDNCHILAVRSDICKIGQLSDRTTVSADNCQWGQLSVRTTVSGTTVSGPWTTVRGNCQCSEKNCKILQLSPLGTVAIYHRLVVAGGGFFLLLDLGPGAAACGMGIEINTGYSCYLSAARRRFLMGSLSRSPWLSLNSVLRWNGVVV